MVQYLSKKPQSKQKRPESTQQTESCHRCGRSNHKSDNCFCNFKDCFKCGMRGHAKAVCRNPGKKERKDEKKVHKLDEDEEVYGMHHMMEKGHNSYKICVLLEQRHVSIEVDTGAARSIVSYDSFSKLKMTGRKMEPANVILRS